MTWIVWFPTDRLPAARTNSYGAAKSSWMDTLSTNNLTRTTPTLSTGGVVSATVCMRTAAWVYWPAASRSSRTPAYVPLGTADARARWRLPSANVGPEMSAYPRMVADVKSIRRPYAAGSNVDVRSSWGPMYPDVVMTKSSRPSRVSNTAFPTVGLVSDASS